MSTKGTNQQINNRTKRSVKSGAKQQGDEEHTQTHTKVPSGRLEGQIHLTRGTLDCQNE